MHLAQFFFENSCEFENLEFYKAVESTLFAIDAPRSALRARLEQNIKYADIIYIYIWLYSIFVADASVPGVLVLIHSVQTGLCC